MATNIVTKKFEVTEYSTGTLRYRIEVRFRGKVVDVFERDTMAQAIAAYKAEGYEPANSTISNLTEENMLLYVYAKRLEKELMQLVNEPVKFITLIRRACGIN